MRSYFVVNYKEIEAGEVDTGVCEQIYTNEKDAIAKCYELSDQIMNENIEVLDKDGDNSKHFCRDTNENGDWQQVHIYDNTYTYWVTNVFCKD